MSQDFKIRFDEYQENDPTPKVEGQVHPDYYPTGGNTRNLAFVLPDGQLQFFNYSYLISCSYNQNEGKIILEFSTHTVELKGQRLERLFFELMAQVNKVIRASENRYSALDSSVDKPIVNEIMITEK